MCISKLFESEKGEKNCTSITVCEIHRRIYDQVIIALADQPEKLKPIIENLERAMIMGVKMNAKLMARRIESLTDLYDHDNDYEKWFKARTERIDLHKKLLRQRKWLEDYMDS